MHDPALSTGGRGYELLLEHCASLTRAPAPRPPARQRLEEALGGELARLLVAALAEPRHARVSV
jgi:hypothetical protein